MFEELHYRVLLFWTEAIPVIMVSPQIILTQLKLRGLCQILLAVTLTKV